MHALRLGTRGSRLALTQAEAVRAALRQHGAALPPVQTVVIRTEGDRRARAPLAVIGGRGVFVKELEEALRDGRIDAAVHSAKDVPSTVSGEFQLVAFPKRGPVHDVWIARDGTSWLEAPPGCRVGTSSLRRAAQLRRLCPGCEVVPIRGNLDTRLRKLQAGQVDALVVAAAGLQRLGREDVPAVAFDPQVFLPAPGQGALVLECRAGDEETAAWLARLDDPETRWAVTAERAFLAELAAGCQVPVAAWARRQGRQGRLDGLVAAPSGEPWLRDGLTAGLAAGAGDLDLDAAAALGRELAGRLRARGAEKVLAPYQ